MRSIRTKHDLRLGTRLNCALTLLPHCGVFVDVGCDHGKLCLAALTAGKAEHAFAIDVSAPSLKKAKELFAQCGQTAEFIETDGIAGLDPAALSKNGEYAVAVCGMGGEMIAAILARGEAAAQRAKLIIMQPMGGERELRSFLFAHGYAVCEERVVRDAGRYYQLIAARYAPGEAAPYADEALLEFGARNYEMRTRELHELLSRTHASRARRMERALRHGIRPETLEQELAGVARLLDHWEDKK